MISRKNRDYPQNGAVLHGFRVDSVNSITEFGLVSVRLTHLETGADVYHLHCGDYENFFAFVFTTLPENDYGIPHILEHTILGGSQRFPQAAPLAALAQGSLCTGYNALTFPDKTVYYAGSIHPADFYNLLLVYGDAVFYPLLRRETFLQEGFCLVEAAGSGVKAAGIVYNELKGGQVHLDKLLEKYLISGLFDGTAYQYPAAGSPAGILNARQAMLAAYHAKYYHPSQVKIFFYGNIPTEEHLRFLQENILGSYSSKRAALTLPCPAGWDSPRHLQQPFPISRDNPHNNAIYTVLGWLLPGKHDAPAIALSGLLAALLVSGSEALLSRALLDALPGTEIATPRGLETELPRLLFSISLKDTNPGNNTVLETAALQALEKICSPGSIDPCAVKNALSAIKREWVERSSSAAPYALQLLRDVLKVWFYGDHPDTIFTVPVLLDQFRDDIQATINSLQQLTRHALLHNMHRLTLTAVPDSLYLMKARETESAFLEALNSTLPREAKQELLRPPAPGSSTQQTADFPALDGVRELTLKDLPAQMQRNEIISCRQAGQVPFYFNHLPTNGIVYVDFIFDTAALAPALSLYLPLFARIFCRTGRQELTRSPARQQLLSSAFQLDGDMEAVYLVQPGSRAEHLFIRVSFLEENSAQVLKGLAGLLLPAGVVWQRCVAEHLSSLVNDFVQGLYSNAQHFAFLRAKQALNGKFEKDELWKGITQYLFLRHLSGDANNSYGTIAHALQLLQRCLFTRNCLTFNITGSSRSTAALQKQLQELAALLPEQPPAALQEEADTSGFTIPEPALDEAVVIPAAAGTVIKVLPGLPYTESSNVYLSLIAEYLGSYLSAQNRISAHAYAVSAFYKPFESYFGFVSYADTRVSSTLALFKQGLEHLLQKSFSARELERAVTGTIAREEAPLCPAEKGMMSCRKVLYGITDALLEERRALLLSAAPGLLKQAGERLLAAYTAGYTGIFADREAIRLAVLQGRRQNFNPAVITLPL